MSRPVFALALDAVPPGLLEAWLAAGAMPNLARLRERGAYGPLGKSDEHPHEASWSALLQGCTPGAAGEWGRHRYDTKRYALEDRAVYQLEDRPPFYSLLGERPAVIFDMPHAPLLPSLRGLQLQGWGVEADIFKRCSAPAPLFADVVRRHGAHPHYGGPASRVLAEESDGTLAGYRVPSLYDAEALRALEALMVQASAHRGAILRGLMAAGPWQLVLATFAELHLPMHVLWHQSAPHPLAPAPRPAADPLARIARAIDEALGAVLEALPRETRVAVFSVSGMAASTVDLPTTVFLPELLYRLQFGEAALAPGDPRAPTPAPATHYRRHWKDEMWALRTARGGRDLESPGAQAARGESYDWCPLGWYQPQWPRMRAFALPSFSHGMVRLNVRGRESAGIVDPTDYAGVCGEIESALRSLVNARTGGAMVSAVARTRTAALDAGAHLPPADLIVRWSPTECADVVDSPLAGRIGPVPWMRTGGHVPDGFCLLQGPGIAPGTLPEGTTICDLTATLLEMLDIEPPAYVEGRSLLASVGA